MPLPWKPSKQKGYEKQEKRVGKKKGHRPQLNSGRTWSGRGDVRHSAPMGEMLIDCKDHSNSKSYRITEKEWIKLKSMAHGTPPGCHPMLLLEIGSQSVVVIEESLWDEISARLR